MKHTPKNDPAEVKRLLYRANEKPLRITVLALQAACMLLLCFRDSGFNLFSLRMALLLPLGTYLGERLLTHFWPIDRALYLLTGFLCSLSIILLRSVFIEPTKASTQSMYLLVGFAAMVLGILVVRGFSGREKLIRIAALPCLILLALPFAFPSRSSAHVWVRFGAFQFQPSELLKPASIFVMASVFSDSDRRFRRWIIGAAYGAAACVILLVQRDLGAVFLYFIVTLAMFVAGTGHQKTALAVLLLAAAGCCVFISLADKLPHFSYISERLEIWQNPWTSKDPNSRQIQQGLISIASGGLVGSGLGLSSAGSVAIVESDYIFAALSESFGLLFTLGVIAVYTVILFRGIWISVNARSRFHVLVCFGCAFELTVQMLLIVTGNLHILPLTGVTLPFVSEGGSSLVGSMLEMGLILGVGSINAQDEYDGYKRLLSGKRGTLK